MLESMPENGSHRVRNALAHQNPTHFPSNLLISSCVHSVPATVTYMANELILQATRRRTHRLVDSFDYYIVPIMNPGKF